MSREQMLGHPALRAGLSLPVLVLLAHALLVGGVASPTITAWLLVLGAVLAVATLWMSRRPESVPAWWQAVASLLGVGLLPVLVVAGLGAPADAFSLLFVLVIVVGAFTFTPRLRGALFAWTLLGWFVALWWDGVRAGDLLLLHLGAGVLIAQTVMRAADDLGRAVTGEAAARAAAEDRADLLARMLQVHTLERDEVLEAVLDGLDDAGFAAGSVRTVQDGELALAAGFGLHQPLEERIPRDRGLPGVAVVSGRTEVVDDPERLRELEFEPEAVGGIAVPVEIDGRVETVVTAITIDGPVQPRQREAAEMLAPLAGHALRRAEMFAADERTVAELQRLEAHTQDFVSTVSHELRTPLTVVQGLGSTLRGRWHDLDPARRQDLLRRIEANAGRLSEMVRSLLDTSAFEEGHIEVARGPVALQELLTGLLHRLASVTAAHPVAVDVSDDVRVDADRSLLEHVLENLLLNIARHTPQGTRVEISARRPEDGTVEIEVADDGPGIPAADLPHVLDRFYRGGDPTLRPAGGLGLGLALANQILQAHGTELAISSEEGRGARFAFALPEVPS